MNPKILSMCSSRNRPNELLRMLESFDRTRTIDTEIVVYLSEDDKHIQEYIDKLRSRRWLYFIGPSKYMVPVLNYFSTKMFPNCEYYQEVNDDHLYHTVGWDAILSKAIEERGLGWGVSYADDRIIHMNTAEMKSGKMVRAVGYFNWPKLKHHYADCQSRSLLTGIGNLGFLCQDAYIQHLCWHDTITGLGVLAPRDENSQWIYENKEEDDYGKATMAEWTSNYRQNDIRKVLEAISADGKRIVNGNIQYA